MNCIIARLLYPLLIESEFCGSYLHGIFKIGHGHRSERFALTSLDMEIIIPHKYNDNFVMFAQWHINGVDFYHCLLDFNDSKTVR